MANGFEISQFVDPMSIWLQPQNILDIAIVAFVIYELLAVIRKTRAAQLAKGAAVVVAVYALAYIFLGLRTVMWVMNRRRRSAFWRWWHCSSRNCAGRWSR